ncbi:type II secretion system protein GspL [Kordiimonas sp.]|uniref:type II secretion system protein GspL n=1 Tax=Kordiimonas sp. TaxID=1970157 RepID=UPI003A8CA307
MSDTLVIELSSDARFVRYAGLVSGDGRWLRDIDADTLASVKAERVVAVLCGTAVSSWSLTLPKLPIAKLLKIAPGLAEEKLARSAADTHFAVWPNEGDTGVVAAVTDDYMKTALATLAALGVDAAVVAPDYMLLTREDQPVAVAPTDGCARVRMPMGEGFSVETELAVRMLGTAGITPISLKAWKEILGGAATTSFNLRQGKFAGRTDVGAMLFFFRRAVVISLMALSAYVGLQFYEASRDSGAADALYQETEALFKASFPDVKRIANMRAQARQEVMKLRQQSGGEFLKLSDLLFAEANSAQGSLLEGLRFDNARGEMAVTISFASFADGEAFKKRLSARGIQVSEGGSRQEGARVVTDLTLRSVS